MEDFKTEKELMFDILWQDNSKTNEDNNCYLHAIKVAEEGCVPFMVVCEEVNGWWGIWMQVGEIKLLVNPMDLVSSLFKDERYYLFETPREEVQVKKPKGMIYVNIRRAYHVIEWVMSALFYEKRGTQTFTYQDYLSKTAKAINQLYQVWKDGNKIAYNDFDVELEAVEMCVKQLNIKSTLPSHYTLMTNDVTLEKFSFYPCDDEWAEKYQIAIGDRGYNTWLTHWDSDYEQIRHQLESITFMEGGASIYLPFDLSETIIRLKSVSVLDKMEQGEKGTAFKYKHYMRVEIEPNEFVHMPILKGYCGIQETIRSLYEGLLKLALRHPAGKEMRDDHIPPKLVAYNKFKSPIIESFLRDDRLDDDEYAIRQVHVKHILRIDPDYDAIMFDEQDVAWSSLEDLYDKSGNPIHFPELEDWQKEIEPIVIASETGKPYEKDWADYHRRGLELAHRLRAILSTDFDLWYAAPFEDKSGTIPKSLLVI